ncbi:DNA-binding protein [Brachybacterium sp. P6-10-X1]|uniref:DNA-binding protein n=1 Tax=Brachybacterium sp. P6-10-X1 TaxID=1903186 RepID=UPI0009718B2E|nr:DNA-binding protein [Brachybacterium sp. P6-10-X1]APX33141.1 DNA-binding protein [Brachybacterium sp. P6-10-X1]
MPRKNDDASREDDPPSARLPPRGEHAQARREQEAREHLLRLGSEGLPAPPWRPDRGAASAVDLAHLALWRSGEAAPEDLLSALALMPSARAEVEGLESGLLFTARAAGLTWAQIAASMGFNSPQACQQHFTRLAARRDAE